MFQSLFAVMNDLLDDIMLRYPASSSQEREEMMEQLTELRRISDVFIEEWLGLEEKLADFRDAFPLEAAAGGMANWTVAEQPMSSAVAQPSVDKGESPAPGIVLEVTPDLHFPPGEIQPLWLLYFLNLKQSPIFVDDDADVDAPVPDTDWNRTEVRSH